MHMSMKHALIRLVVLLACCCTVVGQDKPLPAVALKRVQRYFEIRTRSPYMAQNCEATSYPNWKGFPLKRCHYTVTERGTRKSATVILLLPSPERLARWVTYACLEVKGNADVPCTEKLSRQIIKQSGGQFPVAGIVLEDLLPSDKPDGIYEVYAFRDGVTVGIDGIQNQSALQPTDEQINRSLLGRVRHSGRYARLQGTTREDYTANGGTVEVGDSSSRMLSWLEVSRDLFKAAWEKDRNELLVAWARRHLR